MTLSVASDSEKLRAYTQRKLAIAAQLRGLREILHRRGNSARLRRCEALMTKLAEDRFTLAVLGQFKRGKSSLMNAIIGRELLPTGVLPLTSAITVLKFGPAERLVVDRENLPFPEIVAVTALADYVTQRGNPGNRKRVRTATLELPLPFLRRGLEFVDTPGVGSAIEANTATTYSFLPECDAALFVTSADLPLTSDELEFLRKIREHAQKIFFIVNKIDLCGSETERTEVQRFVAHTIREQIGIDTRIFAISALRGLAAQIARDADEYAGSGLPELQETLATFLSREKAPVFLAAMIERALRLVDEETGEVALFKKARELSELELRKRLEIVRAGLNQRATARRESLDRLHQRLIDNVRESLAPQLRTLLEAERAKMSILLGRILSRAGWRFGAIVAERCAKRFARELGNKIEPWLRKKVASLDFDADQLAREQWTRIQTNLDGLFAVANKEFGLPTRPATENTPAWHFKLNKESQFVRDLPEQISLPVWLACAPAALARPALKRQLESAYATLSESVQADAVESVARAVSDALDQHVARDVDELAGEIESRIEAAITGERPKRRGASQGMRPPEEMDWGDAALAALRVQLEALRDQVAFADSKETIKTERPLAVSAPVTFHKPAQRIVEKDFAKRAKSRGCPVCDELDAVAFDFFAQWQYALAVDEKAQTEFATHGGFCSLHTWQSHAVSSTAGGSAGFAKLVERTARHLAEGKVESLVRHAQNCRVCRLLREAEFESIRRLNEFLRQPANREIYARSQGLCVHHLELAISADSTQAEFLRAKAAQRFHQIAEDMQSYALKRDATRRALTNTDESDALLRAVIHLAGSENLSVPWSDNAEI